MFENLKSIGEAFKNFKSEDTEKEEDTTLQKYLDFQEAKEEFEPTEEQKAVMSMEDIPGQTKTGKEILIEEAKQEKKEDELDKKISDIQKVLKTFSEDTEGEVLDVPRMDTSSDANKLNVKPLDLGAIRQKSYLQGLITQPSSQKDRIALLYESLRKQNLI
jgi:hypothetical protein